MASDVNAPQSAPAPNEHRACWDLVVADMQERDMVGLARYGTRLQPFNGRDALVDLYQELLDAVVYTRQVIEERRSRPTVVCLCGSTRFKDNYTKAQREETLVGRIVLSVGLFGHEEGIDMSGPIKAMLDELHLRKIDMADEILVINPQVPVCMKCHKPCEFDSSGFTSWSICCRAVGLLRPYIGESTRREIAYATKTGKRVRYLEEPHA